MQMELDQFNFMGPAERLAANLQGVSKPLTPVATKQISLRLPAIVVARMDAVAGHTGMSRNDVAGLLVAAGFESVLQLLPADVRRLVEFSSQAPASDQAEG